MREPAGFERDVVGVVGAGRLAGGLGGFVERPTQRWGALAGNPSGPRAAVRAVDADVQAAAAHRLARGGKTGHVAEFAEHGGGRDWPDAVLAHQGLTAGLAAGQGGDLAPEWHQLALKLVDDR